MVNSMREIKKYYDSKIISSHERACKRTSLATYRKFQMNILQNVKVIQKTCHNIINGFCRFNASFIIIVCPLACKQQRI